MSPVEIGVGRGLGYRGGRRRCGVGGDDVEMERGRW